MGLSIEKLRRISRTYGRYEFQDANQDQPLVLHLGTPSELERGYADDLCKGLLDRYVNGGFVDLKGVWQAQPEILYSASGEVLILSEAVVRYACLAFVMQDAEAPAEESYEDPLDLIQIVDYFPEAWSAVKSKVVELIQRPVEKKEQASTTS